MVCGWIMCLESYIGSLTIKDILWQFSYCQSKQSDTKYLAIKKHIKEKTDVIENICSELMIADQEACHN